MTTLTVGELFAGIGGFSLAALAIQEHLEYQKIQELAS